MTSNDKNSADSERIRKFQRLISFIQLSTRNNASLYDFRENSTFDRRGTNFRPSNVSDEEIFGVLLLICGMAAAIANALILIIAVKHLRSRNVLFIIITNFALIDEFKALCAVYMGSAQLFSVAFMKLDQASVYKMLQISVFVFYFGNICSVLNLVLAVTNEFLYIKLPLQYSKFVKKRRVVIAVVSIWLAGVGFSLSKALHSGSNETGAQIWISSSALSAVSNYTTDADVNRTFDQSQSKVIRRPNNVVADVYALILVSVLIFCLFIVGAIYLNLYITIRRATCFRTDSGKTGAKSAMTPPNRQRSDYESPTKTVIVVNGQLCQTNSSFKRKTTKMQFIQKKQPLCSKGSVESFMNHQKVKDHRSSLFIGSGADADQQPMLVVSSDRRSTNFTVPSNCKHRRRDSRLFKRHKCVIVILSVCCLYLIYLSCYFSLQLFHIIHIVNGIDQNKLRERYIINFVLRALFVLHASLNPLIFFRIQTFRSSFLKLCPPCAKIGQTARNGGHSFVELTVPVMDP